MQFRKVFAVMIMLWYSSQNTEIQKNSFVITSPSSFRALDYSWNRHQAKNLWKVHRKDDEIFRRSNSFAIDFLLRFGKFGTWVWTETSVVSTLLLISSKKVVFPSTNHPQKTNFQRVSLRENGFWVEIGVGENRNDVREETVKIYIIKVKKNNFSSRLRFSIFSCKETLKWMKKLIKINILKIWC